jgi:hypothetical protein
MHDTEDPDKIPLPVIVALYGYRDAGRDARETFRRYGEAARLGDRETAIGLERAREGKRYALDRAKRTLDEAIRSWGDR